MLYLTAGGTNSPCRNIYPRGPWKKVHKKVLKRCHSAENEPYFRRESYPKRAELNSILIHWTELYPLLLQWGGLYPISIHWTKINSIWIRWTEKYPILKHWAELYPILIPCQTIVFLKTQVENPTRDPRFKPYLNTWMVLHPPRPPDKLTPLLLTFFISKLFMLNVRVKFMVSSTKFTFFLIFISVQSRFFVPLTFKSKLLLHNLGVCLIETM